eukprot:RCo038228
MAEPRERVPLWAGILGGFVVGLGLGVLPLFRCWESVSEGVSSRIRSFSGMASALLLEEIERENQSGGHDGCLHAELPSRYLPEGSSGGRPAGDPEAYLSTRDADAGMLRALQAYLMTSSA